MNLIKIVVKCFLAYLFILAISSEEARINHHIDIASKNMSNISQTFKTADKAVREYSKEYNEYLDSTFR